MIRDIKIVILKLAAVFLVLLIAWPLHAKHMYTQKITFGRVEEILAFAEKIKFEAKLDTGAKTSSLSAMNIQEFEKNGKTWVSFQIIHPETKDKITKSLPLARYVYIKQHRKTNKTASHVTRPVIKLPICLGSQQMTIEVNLVDRSNFNYPVLLGRDTIVEFNGVVDPNKKFVTVPAC
jgi:hypothetical protein